MVELTLGFPTDISDGLYASEIMDENRGPVAVQSSRVFWDKEFGRLQLDNAHNRKGIETFYDKVKDVESRVCEQISNNSESWFGTKLEFETVRDSLFNTALKVPTRFNEPFSMYVDISDEVSLYDAKKRPRTVEDVVGEVTVLLHAKRVVLSSMSAHIDWEILQVLIHKKKTVIKLSELKIQEEPEEHVPVELFPKKKSKSAKNKVVEPVVEEPDELLVEEVVRETAEAKDEEPVMENESEDEIEEVGELEPTPAKFVLEE